MRLRAIPSAVGKGACLLLVLAWSLLPIYLIVSSSLKSNRDIFSARPQLFNFAPTLENYARLLDQWPQYFVSLWNSAIVTAGSTLLVVVTAAAAGYVYSRYSSRLLVASAFGMIFVRMIPPIVVTLPLFPWANFLGLNDTRTLLILLYASFYVSLGTWIMKAFFDQIPREIDEAAMIDGAGTFALMKSVMMPMAAPGMMAVGVFVVVFAWNEFLFAFIFASTDARTAPMTLSEMTSSVTGVDWGVLFAASTLQLVPVALLVLVAQRYLVAGLTVGSVKG
jgi:multiple sugar transport system permease protein